MQILAPVIPSEPTPPGNVPIIMPTNNWDAATDIDAPDFGGDYAPAVFRTPDGGVYGVFPTELLLFVRLEGCYAQWDWDVGDYVVPDPPNFNLRGYRYRYPDGHFVDGGLAFYLFGTALDIPPGWEVCHAMPEGFSWPPNAPNGEIGETSWTLAQAMPIPPIITTPQYAWPYLQGQCGAIIEAGMAELWLKTSFGTKLSICRKVSTVTERGRKAAAGIVPIISTLFGLAMLLSSGADTSTGRRHGKKRLY